MLEILFLFVICFSFKDKLEWLLKEKSFSEQPNPFDSQTSHFAKARQKISPVDYRAQKEILTGNQSQNVNLSLSRNPNQTLPVISLLRQG